MRCCVELSGLEWSKVECGEVGGCWYIGVGSGWQRLTEQKVAWWWWWWWGGRLVEAGWGGHGAGDGRLWAWVG